MAISLYHYLLMTCKHSFDVTNGCFGRQVVLETALNFSHADFDQASTDEGVVGAGGPDHQHHPQHEQQQRVAPQHLHPASGGLPVQQQQQ